MSSSCIGGVEITSSIIRNLSELTLWNKLLTQRTANAACVEQVLRAKQTYKLGLTGTVLGGRSSACILSLCFVMLKLQLYLIQKFEERAWGLGLWIHTRSAKITVTLTQKPYYIMFLTKKQLRRKEILKNYSIQWIRHRAERNDVNNLVCQGS